MTVVSQSSIGVRRVTAAGSARRRHRLPGQPDRLRLRRCRSSWCSWRSASTPGSTRPGSRCTTPGCRRTTSRASSAWRTTGTCSPTSSSGTRSRTPSRSGSSRPSRSCAWRSGIAHLLNYRLRGRTFFRVAILMPYATSLAAATVIFAELFDPNVGIINWVLTSVHLPGRRLAGLEVAVPDRRLGDRHLAVDRLQRADLPGRHAGDQLRPLRGRGHRRRGSLGAVPPRDAARAAADDPVHDRGLDDRRGPALRRAAALPQRPRRRRYVEPVPDARPADVPAGLGQRPARPGLGHRLDDVPDHRRSRSPSTSCWPDGASASRWRPCAATPAPWPSWHRR